MKLFKDGNALPKRYVWEIVLGAYSVFEKERSLVELTLEGGKSVDVIGDVHGMCLVTLTPTSSLRPTTASLGQYFDVLKLFQLTGEPTETHALLMNGDLVDRGSWSIEVILTAFAFKCAFSSKSLISVGLTWLKGLYPTSMYINRGNHETKDMNRTYGFEGEAKQKHGEQTYKVGSISSRRLNLPADGWISPLVVCSCIHSE